MLPSFSNCLLCASPALSPLPRYKKYFLVRCSSCSFVFSSRIPTGDELAANYASYPRLEYISPVTISRYHRLLQQFEPFRQSGNILDVGCGNGHFLAEAAKKGWQVFGTEYDHRAVAICQSKGITMYKGSLDSNAFPLAFFDVVSSFEVIEHINNPLEEISHVSRLLRQGGLFYITTPNFNSLSRFLLKDKWRIIEYPEHLSYYSPSTLNFLLSNNGFRKSSLLTSGFSFSRGGSAPSQNPAFSDEYIRLKTEKNFFFASLKKIVNALLNFTSAGDTIKAWYVRN